MVTAFTVALRLASSAMLMSEIGSVTSPSESSCLPRSFEISEWIRLPARMSVALSRVPARPPPRREGIWRMNRDLVGPTSCLEVRKTIIEAHANPASTRTQPPQNASQPAGPSSSVEMCCAFASATPNSANIPAPMSPSAASTRRVYAPMRWPLRHPASCPEVLRKDLLSRRSTFCQDARERTSGPLLSLPGAAGRVPSTSTVPLGTRPTRLLLVVLTVAAVAVPVSR